MAHGLTVPMQVYRLPDGVKYLVIEYDDARDAAVLVAALGAEAVHLAVKENGVDVFVENAPTKAE